ncbi:luciferin 4-monooxygenase-like [Anticarsia gemmatalis]|uniref:luciferin 4-monooxygenase-like n=1 Tax=Anticarsia gemmatalis TaxID=129554 RepID=UPI003F776F2D
MKIQVQPFDVTNENYHMGHLFVDVMKSRPDVICQIDAATGESETNASVLRRSMQLARCLRRLGVQPGDVLALGGRNHLDLHIPYYAALLNGMPIAGVDPLYRYSEIKAFFELCEPRVVFCQKEFIEDHVRVIKELGRDIELICFDDGEYSMKKFIREYDDHDDKEVQPLIFDLDKIYAWLVSSSGTTGVMKLSAFKHKLWVKKLIEIRTVFAQTQERSTGENKPALYVAPVQWISGYINAITMPILHQTKIQSSARHTTEHLVDIINKYKPKTTLVGPLLLSSIFEGEKECDFTCFDAIIVSGSNVSKELHHELRKRMRPDAAAIELYGQTENLGPVFMPVPMLPPGCCGNGKYAWHKIKLIDMKTGEEITEANRPGEMWTKGPCMSEYYRNPELTASVFTPDGWFKTGDLLYRDEKDNYYFVERIQMLINGHVIAPSLEELIRTHPGVKDVAVTTVRDKEDGQLPVACVVRRSDVDVTAQEIKDLVASKMKECQRLRGGVVFMGELPMTSSGKVARAKLRHLMVSAYRE